MWIQLTERISHQKWRNLVKKERRKQKRQVLAKERDTKLQEELTILLRDPDYCSQVLEAEQLQQDAERQEAEAVEQRREEWNARDEALHSMWSREQARKKKVLEEREKQEVAIKAEWEKQQQQEAEEEAKRQETIQEKQKHQTDLLQKASEGLASSDDVSQNPEPPQGYNPAAAIIKGEPCPFFIKMGACRFGFTCSRVHEYPSSSLSILLPNMYSHFGLAGALLDGQDSDAALEYEDSETYQHFRTFFQDILPEFKKCGRVLQLRVCCNTNAHLRGNVYVQYENEISAAQAITFFNGRWYAGRQLTCIFVNMNKWKPAICGMFWRQLCPKGGQCNFLHTYRNPGRMFWKIDQETDILHRSTSERSSQRERSARDNEYVGSSNRRSRSRDRSKKHCRPSSSRSEDKHKTPSSKERRKLSDSKDRSKSPKTKETRRNKQKVKSRHKRSGSRSESYDYKRSRSRSKSSDSVKFKSSKTKSHKHYKNSKSHKRSRSRSKSCDNHTSRSRSRSPEYEKPRNRSKSCESRKSKSPSRFCDSKSSRSNFSNDKT